MGIIGILIDDWLRERRIRKHRAEVERLMEKNGRQDGGSTGVRVTSGVRVTGWQEAEAYTETEVEAGTRAVQQGGSAVPEQDLCMEDYDKSGQLDEDLEAEQQKRALDDAVRSMLRVFRTQNMPGSPVRVACAHDGQNIHVSVQAGSDVVGKWRFMLPALHGPEKRIRLYHLNYYHNQAPGPNYHFQKEAKDLYSPEDAAVYILRHDKKKYTADQRKKAQDAGDSLIME